MVGVHLYIPRRSYSKKKHFLDSLFTYSNVVSGFAALKSTIFSKEAVVKEAASFFQSMRAHW